MASTVGRPPTSALTALRDAIFGMQEAPDPSVAWDYESHVRRLAPDASVNLRAFVDTQLVGLHDPPLVMALRVFAEKGHVELIPDMRRLLNDSDGMIRVEAAMALVLVGAPDAVPTFERICAGGDPYDVRETVAELGEALPAEVRQRVLARVGARHGG